MDKSTLSRRKWSAWLAVLANPATTTVLDLVGLPGRMRLPADWSSVGNLRDEHLFYLVTEGSFGVEIGGAKTQAETGDLLWIGPGVNFRCTRDGAKPLSILRARLRITQKSRPFPAPRPWCLVRGAHAAATWLESLIAESLTPAPWNETRTRGLLLVFFTELARLEAGDATPPGHLTPSQRAALLRHVAAKPAHRPTPRELAAVVGLSPDYFARCFHRTFGQSPRRWLLEQRIRHAALHLLETERRVGEVARDFGYADVFLFSRQFKAVTGRSPLQHRSLAAPPLRPAVSAKATPSRPGRPSD